MKHKYSLFYMLRRHFGAIIRSDAWGSMVLDGVIIFFNAAGSIAATILTQYLFESTFGFAEGTGSFEKVVWLLVILTTLNCVSSYVNVGFHIYGRNMLKNAERIFSCSLHEKAARIDPADFEKPEMLDLINRARVGVGHSTSLVFIGVLAAAYYFPYYIGMTVYLFRLDPILALALPLSAVPPLISLMFRLFYFGKIGDQTGSLRRKFEYYETAIIDRDNFKETRTLGAFHFLDRKYRDAVKEYGNVFLKQEGKSLRADMGLTVLDVVIYLCIVGLAIFSLFRGNISVGAFAAVFASIHNLMGMVSQLLLWHFSNVATNFSAIQGYFLFMDLPEREGKGKLPDNGGGIELKAASFRYLGSDKESVKNVTLSVRDGETIAVVGRNGAGKSTLVRLMAGLYLPEKGSVKLFGRETRDLDLKEIGKRTSAVFQDYQRYRYPLDFNVGISDTSKELDQDRVKDALEKADLPLPQPCFPDGEATMLSREFGGVDLSGGQWQRVAIARGLYRSHDLLLLDEPTAAIDPLEEKRLYEKFMELAAKSTAILVTHRLGSAKMADRILVMEDGRVEGFDTHEKLMENCRLYREMYESQAGWYM